MTGDWRSKISFTTRTTAIVRISNRLKAVSSADAGSSVFAKAQRAEQEVLDASDCLEDYEARLDALIDGLDTGPASPRPGTRHGRAPSLEQTPLPNVATQSFGRYKHALHHRDGLFSDIYRTRAPPDRPDGFVGQPGSAVALKVTYLSSMMPPHDSEREVRLLQKAASPHIIALWEAFRQPGGLLILVFPYLPHDLEQLLKSGDLTRSQGLKIMKDALTGLAHLHSIDMIHRDVKPANILVNSAHGPAYLADLGIAWCPSDPASEPADEKVTDVGSTHYRAPELLFGLTNYTRAIDSWATGCVLVEVLSRSRRPLFDSGELGSDLALINSIFQRLGTPNAQRWPNLSALPDWGKVSFYEYPTKSWQENLPDIPDDGTDLIDKLIRYPWEERSSMADALKHRVFSDQSVSR